MKLQDSSSKNGKLKNNKDEINVKQTIDDYFKLQSNAIINLKQPHLKHICSESLYFVLHENTELLINKIKSFHSRIIYYNVTTEFCSLTFENNTCTAKVKSKETLKFDNVSKETLRINLHEFELSKIKNKWIIFKDKDLNVNNNYSNRNSQEQHIRNKLSLEIQIALFRELIEKKKTDLMVIPNDDDRNLNRGMMRLYQIENWNKRPKQWGDFDNMGGDCTNYASQVLYAGGAPMITVGNYKWYYYGYNNRYPSWTGVEEFYDYLINNKADGVHGIEVQSVNELKTGDIIQMDLDGDGVFNHTSVVCNPLGYNGVLPTITSHSLDRFNEPILTFNFTDIRLIHLR